MKKIAFIVCLCLLATIGHAQLKLSYGPKSGLNFSTFSYTFIGDQQVRTGLHVGGFLNLRLGKFALQPELLYSMQGYTFDIELTTPEGPSGEVVVSTIQYDYLQIPVMVKYYLVGGLYLEVGPQFGILVNTSESYMRGSLKKGDIGLGVGAGYEFKIGLMAGYRYTHGFMDTYKESALEKASQNRVHQLSFGWKF